MKRLSQYRYFLAKNKWIIIISTVIMLIGICAGIFLERGLLSDDKDAAFRAIEDLFFAKKNSVSIISTFIGYFKNSFFIIIIYAILSILVVTIPLTLAILFFDGFCTGFTSTLVLDFFGSKGQPLVAMTILPHSLFNLFIFILLQLMALNYLICFKDMTLDYLNKKIKIRPRLKHNTYALGKQSLIILLISSCLNLIQTILVVVAA